MDIQESVIQDVTVITINGRLWGETEGDNLSESIQTMKARGCHKVIIDMMNVSLMNSSGLGSLIAGLKSLRDANGDLKLVNVNERIKEILKITKLYQVFNIYEALDEAIEDFGHS